MGSPSEKTEKGNFMKTHTQILVIGGGVVGCSVLYHLAKMGCKECMLLERTELTSGSTWHAAGSMHLLNGDLNVAKLQEYTVNIYREIEEISGHSCGLHKSGGLYLASNPSRLDWLKKMHGQARHMGLDFRLISPAEAQELAPVIDDSQFLGALYDPLNNGHIDPAGVTHAYAKAARHYGAEIELQTPVQSIRRNGDNHWDIETPKGRIVAEIVVNAGGLWAREIGAMLGVSHPVQPIEHQYLVTETIPEIEALDSELPHLLDLDGENYLRQEGKGILIGTYEQRPKAWAVDGTPADFGLELLESDIGRLMDNLERAYKRYPCLAKAGVKQIINGPMVFAPDGNPLVGPVPGVPGYYAACGVMAGFSQGGGVGKIVAEWIIEGLPSMDVTGMDVARFGDYATKAFTQGKTAENYRRRFSIAFPDEELPDERPLMTTPIYDRLIAENAVMGASFGLEHALWFAPKGTEPAEKWGFRRTNAFAPVARECKSVREKSGLIEIANFAKYRIRGRDARAFLCKILAGRLPRVGRVVLSPMLDENGRLAGDVSLAQFSDNDWLMIASGAMQAIHGRWFAKWRKDMHVEIENLSLAWPGFALAGPNSRHILQSLTGTDLSNDAWPFMKCGRLNLGAVSVWMSRISYTGELGYEIYTPASLHLALFRMLREAGTPHGMALFGGRALSSLRMEKGFGAWRLDLTPDYTAHESGLARFVDTTRDDFIGAETFHKQKTPELKLVLIEIDNTQQVDCSGNEPILDNGKPVGRITSGAFGHTTGLSLALGYVPSILASGSNNLSVEILGVNCSARILSQPPVDPEGKKMRS